ncbi:BatD family protein [Stieleria sp. ICT_E10.1]|uniref:BatD family protein n=1 Tax=Stieleria sedimenti TaxID=2976331 RepID=UPI00217FC1FA|nr:BatD family protein [Stieleria sedimenti]MCS7467363.1 BatD family protein [Stieleria sedimenti]
MAQLAEDSAWTGEAVSLVITLYSPGPFSGTAAFDLPELPQTVLMRGGSPLVGSESIDGETLFTQRHELTVYTQRSGTIEIPAFRVRFSGKKTFTSSAEPIEGVTPRLTFESKRPPGTDRLGFVLTASSMQVTQSWSPDAVDTLSAGDVIERRIKRIATGTTAMMIAPISSVAPEGVRVYDADPVVQDRSERGDSSAERSDTVKYQFERPGTFTLADTTIVWWDADAGELKREILDGKTIRVVGNHDASQARLEPGRQSNLTGLYMTSAVTLCIGIALMWKWIPTWTVPRGHPEAVAAERLLAACRDNDANRAYAALLRWKRMVSSGAIDQHQQEVIDGTSFSREQERLARRLFGEDESADPWTGKQLASAFTQTRRALVDQRHGGIPLRSPLPALNPFDSNQRQLR